MKRRKTIKDRATIPASDRVAWLMTSLMATIASIVALILFRRRRQTRPRDEVEPETIPTPPVPVADDDPQIFNLRTFRYFTVVMVGLVLFALLAAAFFAGFFTPGGSLVITPASTLLPPGPGLESYPGEIFPALHATQEAELNSYGWVDRQKGVVHIPIERAMELLAQSKLPVASGTPVAATPYAP